MATRQYIGARYVPKFADPIAWDNARSYEALEIVTYLGTSYTSKKNVPVGTAITNTEYWVATGNYNAQVAEYVAMVENLASTANRKYRNVIIIADSYGTSDPGEGAGHEIANPLPDRIKTYLGLTNTNFRANCANGAGFSNGAFNAMLGSVASGMTADEKAKVTDICFIGGWNDRNATQQSFNSAISTINATISSNFPNAIKHVMFVGRSIIHSTYDYLNDAMTLWDSLALSGWTTHKNLRYVLINPEWMFSDTSHPNQTGVDKIAYYVAYVLKTGDADVEYRFSLKATDYTMDTGYKTNMGSVDGFIEFVVNNNQTSCKLYTPGSNWQIWFVDEQDQSTTKSITFNGSNLKIASMTSKVSGYYENASIPINGYSLDSSNTKNYFNGSLLFKDNEIFIKLPYIHAATGSGALTIAAKNIMIGNGAGTIDSDYM